MAKTRSPGAGAYCYCTIVILLVALFFFGWLKPATVSKFGGWINEPTSVKLYAPPAPETSSPKLKVTVNNDRILLNGEKYGKAKGVYECLLMPMDVYAAEGADPEAWFAAALPRPFTGQSASSLGARPGDALYVRLADADEAASGAQPGAWSSVRLEGAAINYAPSYTAFNLSPFVGEVEKFVGGGIAENKIQKQTVLDELSIYRTAADVLPYAAGLALLLLAAFLWSVLFRPQLRRRIGTVAFVWTALLGLFVSLGATVINELFLARESNLLSAGEIKWINWTGFLGEATLFPYGVAALSLVALFTLHFKNKKKLHLMLKSWQLYILLVPAIVLFAVFSYGPMFGVTLAFKEYHLASTIQQMPWVGLHWFQYAFSDPGFLAALGNSIIISALHMLFGFPAPILLALLVNELRSSSYRRLTQTISFMPQFLSWVVIGSVFIGLLSLDGPINQLIMLFGGKSVHFLGLPDVFRGTLIVTSIWKGIGYSSIIYLAAIAGVDPQLYECAKLDGSSRLKNMWYITLPCISGVVIVMLILRLGSILEAGFDQIVNMYNPTVYSTSDIIDTFIYRKVFLSTSGGGSMYDYSAAVGLFKSVVGLIFIVGSNMLARRVEGKEAALW